MKVLEKGYTLGKEGDNGEEDASIEGDVFVTAFKNGSGPLAPLGEEVRTLVTTFARRGKRGSC